MRTVAEIREYIRLHQHELDADQLEMLEVEMLEAETYECESFVSEQQLAHELNKIKPNHRTHVKQVYMIAWFKGLSVSDKKFVASRALEVYRTHNKEWFRLRAN